MRLSPIALFWLRCSVYLVISSLFRLPSAPKLSQQDHRQFRSKLLVHRIASLNYC
jgi:hypothetical protein